MRYHAVETSVTTSHEHLLPVSVTYVVEQQRRTHTDQTQQGEIQGWQHGDITRIHRRIYQQRQHQKREYERNNPTSLGHFTVHRHIARTIQLLVLE